MSHRAAEIQKISSAVYGNIDDDVVGPLAQHCNFKKKCISVYSREILTLTVRTVIQLKEFCLLKKFAFAVNYF